MRQSNSKKAGKASRKPTRNSADSSEPSPAPVEPPEKKRWTVMVYLAGDNNLTEECAFAISEMKLVEPSDQVYVLVQFDPKGTNLPTQRFQIHGPYATAKKKSGRAIVHHGPSAGSPYNLGETHTGSPRALYDFVAYGIQMFPAHSYIVVLAGHGGGIEDSFLLRDENPTGTLSLREMKIAFRAIKNDFQVEVDIVGLDTCLMSMAEVGYQLKDLAKILVGSEGYAPLGGWPYRPILEMIYQKADHSDIPVGCEQPDPNILKREREDVARSIVCTHASYYLPFVPGGVDVEQSALDLTRSSLLASLVYELGYRLKAGLSETRFRYALILAHWDAQSYNGEIYLDLSDFCRCLRDRMDDIGCVDDHVRLTCLAIEREIGAIEEPCNQLNDSNNLPNHYVLKSCYTGPAFQYSYGVSIYFPWYEVVPYYEDLDFAQTTKWHEFLEAYVIATRRPPRQNGDRIMGDANSTLPIRQSSGKQSSGKYDRPVIRSMRNAPISLQGTSKCFDPNDPVIEEIFRGL